MKKLKFSSSFIQRYRLLLTLILTLVVGLCGYKVYETTVQAAIDPVLIPVAARYLKSGTVIQREDIQMIEVPRPVVLEGVEKDPELLLGQAVDTYNAIAEGSLFYEALLIPKEELHDVSAFPLLENEAAVTIDADIKTSYANSILPGHQIDLYFQGYATQADESEKRVLYGQLVSQARVIAVRDSTGKNIDAQSDKATSVIVVALAYEDADLVQRAKFFGTVLPMVTYGSLNPLENEAAVTIDADIKTSYANSILPGHLIDLYFQGYATQADESEKRVLYGQLVSQARVIAVRDSTGKNIDAQSDKATSVIVVALAYEDADLVQRAKFFGTVLPMVTYGSLNPESQVEDFYDIAKMRELLYQKTIDVSLVKEALEDE